MEQGWVWGKRAETEPPPAGVSGGGMLMLPGLWHLGFSTRGAGVSLGGPPPPSTDSFWTAHSAGARKHVAPPAITAQAAGGTVCGS